MSVDIVDDLQAAEDHAETIRTAARKAVNTWNDWCHPDNDPPPPGSPEGRMLFDAFCDAMVALGDASEEPFRRPTCEDDQCDWTADGSERLCGGYHPDDELCGFAGETPNGWTDTCKRPKGHHGWHSRVPVAGEEPSGS